MTQKKSNRINEIKKHAIYVLMSPFDQNVYLGNCGADYLKLTYSKQYNLHHKPTADLFRSAKEQNLPVHMFLLQEVECSTRELFRYTIAWAKHLVEQGYELGLSESLIPYTNNFTEETSIIYESIKGQPLNELMEPSKSLFPNYRKLYKEQSDSIPSQIKFRVTPTEYETILQRAKSDGVSLSHYCRHKALYNRTVKLDVMPLSKICSEYVELNALLKQVIAAIYWTKEYYPADLAIVQDAVKTVTELEKKLLSELKNFLNQIHCA